jgi:transposase
LLQRYRRNGSSIKCTRMRVQAPTCRVFGHEVIVANARQVQLISKSSRKNDRMDAQTLARLMRVDPRLLRPIQHRSEQAQGHLRVIRVRAALVEARTMLVNAARGLTKATGERLPSCDADFMGVERMESLPAGSKTPRRSQLLYCRLDLAATTTR